MLPESTRILMLRDRLGKPTPSEVTDQLARTHLDVRTGRLAILKKEEEMVQFIKKFEPEAEKKPRPSLTGRFVQHTFFHDDIPAAMDVLRQNRIAEARYVIDANFGMIMTLGRLNTTLIQVVNSNAFAMEVIRQKQREGSLTDEEKMNEYLKLQRVIGKDVDLLVNDPTGFTFIDHTVDELAEAGQPGKLLSPLPPFMSRDYILAGARLARDLYKETYGIADRNNIGSPLFPPATQ
jgi:hypothetical protein